MRTQLLQWSVLVLGLTAASCSNGPAPPQPGSPAFLWGGAQTTFRAGDVLRTGESLQRIISTDNEFTARARPWSIVISAGVTQGYLELADAYDVAAKANRANPMPFNKEASALRSLASSSALEFAQGVHGFLDKDKDEKVLLAFEYPTGAAAQPPALARVSSGILIQESEREALKKAMVQRGVLLMLCRVVGSPDDTAKTLETMKGPEVRIPRATFMYAVAKALHDESALFGGTKLDRPDRLKMMCTEALETLKGVPENKDTKQLMAKIQASLKKIKGSV